jgi:CHASE2 domain-containing sensor protein/signal transduction histidine kinase
VLLVVACVLALPAAGLLRPADDWFYDTVLAHAAPAGASRVLVIESPPAQLAAGDALLLRLLRTLHSLGARQIAFTFMPSQASPAFYEAGARAGVVFGRRRGQPLLRGTLAALAPLPPAAMGLPLRLAVAEPWPAPGPVQRSQQHRFLTDHGSLPALEALVVEGTRAALPPAPYRVRFGTALPPRLSIGAVLSGELTPEQAAGKVVVIGPALDEPVFTPVGRMPALQFHAHAIDTLLRGTVISEVPAPLRLLALVAAAVLGLAWPGLIRQARLASVWAAGPSLRARLASGWSRVLLQARPGPRHGLPAGAGEAADRGRSGVATGTSGASAGEGRPAKPALPLRPTADAALPPPSGASRLEPSGAASPAAPARPVTAAACTWLGWVSVTLLLGVGLMVPALSAGLLLQGWWLPPAGPALGLALGLGVALMARQMPGGRTLARLQADARARMDRLGAQTHEAGTDVWQEVRALATHHLPLRRSLFLVLEPATGRLREVLAIDCDLGVLTERRRHVSRPPYREAVSQGQAVVVSRLLREGDVQEMQYLVPLSRDGRLEGMWALAVQPAELQRASDFHATLNVLAIEIARRLGMAGRRGPPAAGPAVPPAAAPGDIGPAADVHRALLLLEQRAATWRKALEHLDTAAAAFDELGRQWFVNAAMGRVLDDLELTATPAVPILLARVAGRSPEEARHLLRRVVVRGERIHLAAHRMRSGAVYQLTLTPLPPGSEATPLNGVLCELAVVSAAVQPTQTDERQRRRARLQLAGAAAALTTAGLRLAEGSPALRDGQQLRRLAGLVRSETLKAMQALDAVQRADDDPSGSRPVDLGGALDRVLADLAGALQARRIGVARSGVAATQVRADPTALHHVLKAVLELLLTDCVEAGEICVQSEEAAGRVYCRFASTGGGMPNKQLLDCLGGAPHVLSPEFARLRSASRLVSRWGATLRGASDVGQGTRFELILHADRP